jgi:hypothetical protein
VTASREPVRFGFQLMSDVDTNTDGRSRNTLTLGNCNIMKAELFVLLEYNVPLRDVYFPVFRENVVVLSSSFELSSWTSGTEHPVTEFHIPDEGILHSPLKEHNSPITKFFQKSNAWFVTLNSFLLLCNRVVIAKHFLCRRAPQQMLRTRRSLKACCASL